MDEHEEGRSSKKPPLSFAHTNLYSRPHVRLAPLVQYYCCFVFWFVRAGALGSGSLLILVIVAISVVLLHTALIYIRRSNANCTHVPAAAARATTVDGYIRNIYVLILKYTLPYISVQFGTYRLTSVGTKSSSCASSASPPSPPVTGVDPSRSAAEEASRRRLALLTGLKDSKPSLLPPLLTAAAAAVATFILQFVAKAASR